VNVAAEAVSFAEQLQHANQIVHDLHRPPRNPGRDEQTLTPPALPRREEDADELLRLEECPRHLAIAAHRAVVAVEAAGVGHEDAEQRLLPAAISPRADLADVERP
jgi:hypothetical protein